MSELQLNRWMQFAEVEPFGMEVADFQSAQIVAMLANIHRDPKRRPKPFTARDFMLSVDRQSSASSGPRRPMTDPSEWAKVKSAWKMAASDRGKGVN